MFYIWAEGPKSVCWRTLDFALAAWQPSARPLPRGRLPRGPAGGLRPRPYFFSGQVAGQCCASQIWVGGSGPVPPWEKSCLSIKREVQYVYLSATDG
jgi:hypothetical protein